MRVEQAPGFLLHARAFGETSAIVEMFTEEHGRIALLARGIRKRPMLPAVEYLLSWSGRGELPTLSKREERRTIPTTPVAAALLYCHELLSKLTTRHDPDPTLYAAYTTLLSELHGPTIFDAISGFEYVLLQQAGLLPELGFDREGEALVAVQHYLVFPESGVRAASHSGSDQLRLTGSTLQQLAAGLKPDTTAGRREARQLSRALIDYHLGGRAPRARSLLIAEKEISP